MDKFSHFSAADCTNGPTALKRRMPLPFLLPFTITITNNTPTSRVRDPE